MPAADLDQIAMTMSLGPNDLSDDRYLVAAILFAGALAGGAIWLVRDTTWAIVLLAAFVLGGRVLHTRLKRSGRAEALHGRTALRIATVVLWGTLAVVTAWVIVLLIVG